MIQSNDCHFTKFEIVGENGVQQTIGIKNPDAASCSKNPKVPALPPGAGVGNSPSPHLGFRLIANGAWTFITPKVLHKRIHIKEIVPRCEYIFKEDPCGLCDEVLRNTSMYLRVKSLVPSCNFVAIAKKCTMTIMESNFFSVPAGFKPVNYSLVYGVVLINLGLYSNAIEQFNDVIEKFDDDEETLAYFYRSVALMKKSIQTREKQSLYGALHDLMKIEDQFTDVIIHIRKAEVYSLLGQHFEARRSLSEGIDEASTVVGADVYVRRGMENMKLEKFREAENDFRSALDSEESDPLTMYYLAAALQRRGNIRNAIEVYKEGLKLPVNKLFREMKLGLSESYLALGLSNHSLQHIMNIITNNPNNSLAWKLKADAHYNSGRIGQAARDYDMCVSTCDTTPLTTATSGDATNNVWCEYCQYMSATCYATRGRMYDSLKRTTKLIVKQQYTSMKLTPEYVKAHYLKEYARYLHSHLDQSPLSLSPESHLPPELTEGWVKSSVSGYKGTREQPGLNPAIQDVDEDDGFSSLSPSHQQILCSAYQVGQYLQVTVDGFFSNERLHVGTGLAALHIAQHVRARWVANHSSQNNHRSINNSNHTNSNSNWRDVFNIAVAYRRLVDSGYPVVWLDKLSLKSVEDGFYHDSVFLRGEERNVKLSSYFKHIFDMMKNMVQHSGAEEIRNADTFEDEVKKSETCEDLLSVARRHSLNQNGFLISTQVPSMQREDKKLDGVILTLTNSIHDDSNVLFSVSTPLHSKRVSSYHTELHSLFSKFLADVKKKGHNSQNQDIDAFSHLILSLMYYFYNLAPLSRGTSAVAYAVAVGLFMSLGFEVSGKLPQGKLLQFEALFSGTPDTFFLMINRWLNLKKNPGVASATLPSIESELPTVRDVLRLLNTPISAC